MTAYRIPATALRAFVTELFVDAGCAAEEADAIATSLVQSNLFGHDSHGVGLVPVYLRNLQQGLVRAGQAPRIVTDAGAFVGFDGCKGFGQTVAAAAMREAIARAGTHGVAIAGLANVHHVARIGQWAEQCAQAGFASVHFVNVLSTPLVAPFGGIEARLATNPFCVGVPHVPDPIVLDYATSAIAYGKVRVAMDEGRRLPPGVALDRHGKPTDDPAELVPDRLGALLPFGEHKGYALAVICELLGGALSGGCVQDHDPKPSPMINNMLSIVFAPHRFCTPDAFAADVERLSAWLASSRLAQGSTGIVLPGAAERAIAREREAGGIPLPASVRRELAACAQALGVDAGDALANAGAPL